MMNRREFLAMAAMGAASTALSSATSDPFTESTSTELQETMTNKPPKLLVFDVNETLLDLSAMKERVAEALGGRGDLLPLWFTTMLQYSLVSTVGDNYIRKAGLLRHAASADNQAAAACLRQT
jgi:2-haloacid dehalogenase